MVLRRSTFHHGFSQALQDASGCCDEIIHIHTYLEPIVVFWGFKGIKETLMKCLVGILVDVLKLHDVFRSFFSLDIFLLELFSP